MSKVVSLLLLLLLLLLCALCVTPALGQDDPAKKSAGAPTTQRASKRVLVFNKTEGFKHASIPTSAEVFRKMDATSEIFEFVVTDDAAHFDKDKLNTYDAVYKWPAFGEMMGGYFDGHPWNAGDTVTIKIEQEANPITAPWGKSKFQITDEIYQMKEPYDRKKQDVLLSLDTDATDMTKPGIKRTDKDVAVAWTKGAGQGRVFYTSLGHNDAVWKDPRYQAHLMAGLQWVTRLEYGKPEGAAAAATAPAAK
jgi:hypothetical protein